jgi:adenylate kinase family enzyme
MSMRASTPRRIVVVGCCGAGKSPLAAALARRLAIRHVERDSLGEEGSATYRAAAGDAVTDDSWIFDGAPYWVEDVVYPRAELVVALDYPRRVVMRRVVARSLRLGLPLARARRQYPRIPFRRWRDPSHAVRWAWGVWGERRREIGDLRSRPELAGADIVRLRSPTEGRRWLSSLAPDVR